MDTVLRKASDNNLNKLLLSNSWYLLPDTQNKIKSCHSWHDTVIHSFAFPKVGGIFVSKYTLSVKGSYQI